jgi:hypothetical protein
MKETDTMHLAQFRQPIGRVSNSLHQPGACVSALLVLALLVPSIAAAGTTTPAGATVKPGTTSTAQAKPAATSTTSAPATSAPTSSAPTTAPAGAPLVPSTVAAASIGPRDVTKLEAKVSYLAGGTIYLEVGREDGLHEGDTLSVQRAGALLGRITVTVLATHRASCDTLGGGSAMRIGDAVHFVAHNRAMMPAPVAANSKQQMLTGSPVMPLAARARHEVSPLHGRVGARFLSVQDNATGSGFSQPALDVLLNGSNMGGVPIDLQLDARSRRTIRTLSTGGLQTDAATRVYRASLALHDKTSRFRMTVGRQTSPTLSSISIFDGVLAEYTGTRLNGGLFSGTQPDPIQDNISSSIFEHGAYVELHQVPTQMRRWSLALGGVTSTQNGQVNRDFVFTQAYYQTIAFSANLDQEVDVNRGWKLAAGEQRFTPTSTFAMMRFQVAKPLSVNMGYDNRRNVRLYRDLVTPITEFDDAYRNGEWIGASLEASKYVRLDGDARHRGGVPTDRSDAWSAGGQVSRIGFWNAAARARYSTFSSLTLTSSLTSLGLGIDPLSAMHIEGATGRRTSLSLVSKSGEIVNWTSVDFDLTLARRWYVNGSIERDKGGTSNLTQEYVGLSWRF